MTEENIEMVSVDETLVSVDKTPKPEEPPETIEKMKPATTEQHKPETLKPSRVKIREVEKQRTDCQESGLSRDNFNEDN